MAKRIIKPKVEKPKVKTSQEDTITGNLFLNPTKVETEIPLEITNSENTEEIERNKPLVDKTETVNNSKNKFSLSENIFIEVHKSNLLQYFSSGCIYPSKYSSQKAFSDPQAINENGLFISNGFISNNKDHILIQIHTSAINSTLLSVKDDFGLYTGIIPVSRIRKIFVQNIETKKKTLDDSLIRDAGIIPETLIEVGFPSNLLKISYEELSISPKTFESKLKQFDKILGLIAGTRNFNLLTYNQTGKYKSISDHSLFAVQAIDETFAREIVDSGSLSDYYKWLFTNSCPNDRPLLNWLFNRVYDNANFTDSDTNEFESLCDKTNSFPSEEKLVKNIFSALRKSLERKKVMTDILALHSKNSLALYVFAYLRNFGTNQNPELPRVELINSTVTKFSEYAFATLNFFFGYKQLRNSEDRLNISDEVIKKFINIPIKPTIKFELTTEFDYKIIDSVFNLVFGIKNNDLANYKNILVEKGSTNVATDGYDCYSTVIFGKLYQRIIKSNVLEQILPLLNKLPNEITIFSEFGLLCHRSGLKRHFIGLEELIGNPKSILRFVYYSKADLIDAINENKIDLDEIKQRIVLSQKHKEL
ncbi:MAG TPA: hypothetical protein PLJ42_10530 [Chitinophagales bacterium]|nr:hypothetical protein [Chitinophagales bacterium]HQW79858.1 hypothetical protein [Chitinophagales bacterium]